MGGAFECTHCGACCKKETSPVNVTLGDVKRISEFLGKPPDEIIGTNVKMRPFLDANEPGRFDVELGLPKPCHFWKDGKCSVYKARPLNCRLFPFWLYASLSDGEIAEQTLPGYECIINSRVDEAHRAVYKEYARRLAKLIMRESKITDEFMEKNGFHDEVVVEGHDDAFEIVLAGPGPRTEKAFIEVVRAAEGRVDSSAFVNLPEAIARIIASGQEFASVEELEEIEHVIKERYKTS